MIVDYVLDFVGLFDEVKAARDDEEVSRLFWQVDRLMSIMSHENGRFVVAGDSSVIIDKLRSLPSSLVDGCDPAKLMERRLADMIISRLPSEDACDASEMLRIRKIDTDEVVEATDDSGVEDPYDRILRKSFSARPNVDFYVNNKRIVIGGKKARQIQCYETISEYFEEGESLRLLRYRKMTVVPEQYANEGTVKYMEFSRQVRAFAVGESSFRIIDKYLFGGSEKYPNDITARADVLCSWLILLTNENRQSCAVDIHTKRHCGLTHQKIRSAIEEEWEKLCKGSVRKCEIEINIKFEGDSDCFHDRFVCSGSYYFALGRGLDGVGICGVSRMFNVYPCGWIDREQKLPYDIRDFESSHTRDTLAFTLSN